MNTPRPAKRPARPVEHLVSQLQENQPRAARAHSRTQVALNAEIPKDIYDELNRVMGRYMAAGKRIAKKKIVADALAAHLKRLNAELDHDTTTDPDR